MPRRQRAKRVLIRGLVSFQRQLPSLLSLLMPRKFGKVPVIIALPVYAGPGKMRI